MDAAAFAELLGVSLPQFYLLMSNVQFPVPTSNDGNGAIEFDDGAGLNLSTAAAIRELHVGEL